MQGLRLVPLGIVFLGSAAWRSGCLFWLPGAAGSGAQFWFFASAAVAVALSYNIRAWYERRFGWYLTDRTRTGATTLVMSAVGFVVLATVQPSARTVSWPLLYVAALLAVLGLAQHGLRRHYLAISAGCVLFGFARLLGASFHTTRVGFDLLIGLGLIVAGVGDHFVLDRACSTQEREGDVHV
jgi:hypothetical protein